MIEERDHSWNSTCNSFFLWIDLVEKKSTTNRSNLTCLDNKHNLSTRFFVKIFSFGSDVLPCMMKP
jgi:hypothetical protein